MQVCEVMYVCIMMNCIYRLPGRNLDYFHFTMTVTCTVTVHVLLNIRLSFKKTVEKYRMRTNFRGTLFSRISRINGRSQK